MRYHDDPRWNVSRVGQVEFRAGPNSGTNRWGRYTPHPLGGWLTDGVTLAPVPELRLYRWRDPARARHWARLPADLIELMQAEAAEAGEPPLEPPRLQPPARQGSGPAAGRGPRTTRPGGRHALPPT